MEDEYPGLGALLNAQLGVITAAQAARLGIHPMVLRRWVDARGWRHPLPRIYVHPTAEGFETDAMALCLWGGKGAVLSHGGAARLLGLAGVQKAEPEVTLESARSSHGARVHRGVVPREDRRVTRGIPHTSEARTLIDLAAVVSEETLAIAFEDAWKRKLIQLDWVERRLAELGARGRPGADALQRVLRDAWRRGKPLDSSLEVRFWRFAREYLGRRLPTPGFELWPEGGGLMIIDFAFPAQRLAIEAHSFQFHGQVPAHERDAVRASRLARIGWRVHFVTSGQLERPDELAEAIREELAFDMSRKPPPQVVNDSFWVPASEGAVAPM
jgi:hypothetical protein